MSRTFMRLPPAKVRKGDHDKVRRTKVHQARPQLEPTIKEGLAEVAAEERNLRCSCEGYLGFCDCDWIAGRYEEA